jgi:glucose-6-phosphate 1-dehydrogenase
MTAGSGMGSGSHATAKARPTSQFGTLGHPTERADICTMVIFGATGDLTKRKLFPALYSLAAEHLIAPGFSVLGVGRDASETDQTFRDKMRAAVEESEEVKSVDEECWLWLAQRIFYSGGEATDSAAYEAIKVRLAEIEASRPEEERNRFFYLAVPPSVFEPIVRHLSDSGLVPRHDDPMGRPWARVVVEKPFGHSLETALELNALVLSLFAEHQVYRIDHFLGKETVQNILVLRFANSIFEPVWNRRWIFARADHAAEASEWRRAASTTRKPGVIRDMFQNHLLQLLALTAMEPPPSMTADAVRDEKVKVLKSFGGSHQETIPSNAVPRRSTRPV